MVVFHWVTVGAENLQASQVVEVALDIPAWRWVCVLLGVKAVFQFCHEAITVVGDYPDSTGHEAVGLGLQYQKMDDSDRRMTVAVIHSTLSELASAAAAGPKTQVVQC